MISKEDVEYLAKLARVEMNEKEIEKFSGQLSDIFKYVDLIQKIDTKDVVPTSQVTGLVNVLEEDEVREYQATPAELLACSEHEVDSNQVKVMRIV
jgi:aspartyl-tRNA(Asn)/glutamyl-tRNA(Gln) amidotransferase subunit C